MAPHKRGRFLAIVAHCVAFMAPLCRYYDAIVAPLWSDQVPQFGGVEAGLAGMGSVAKLLALSF
jgi:hypothetical protein